jgi:hypothetical protein
VTERLSWVQVIVSGIFMTTAPISHRSLTS